MLFRGDHIGLHEELVLLALEDRKGTFQWKDWGLSVGGAILTELLLHERVRLDAATGKKSSSPFVVLVDDEPLGCPVLDDTLERIASSTRRARLSDWISRTANRRGLHQDIARQLCRRGILREDETTVMLFFRRRIFPEVNPIPERRLLQRLEGAIFGEGSVDERTTMLVALAQAGRLLDVAFDKSRLKPRKSRIEYIVAGNEIAAATKQVIDQVRTAITVTVITAAT